MIKKSLLLFFVFFKFHYMFVRLKKNLPCFMHLFILGCVSGFGPTRPPLLALLHSFSSSSPHISGSSFIFLRTSALRPPLHCNSAIISSFVLHWMFESVPSPFFLLHLLSFFKSAVSVFKPFFTLCDLKNLSQVSRFEAFNLHQKKKKELP